MYKSENGDVVRKVIVIDDNPDIHRDFKTIFQSGDFDTSEIDEIETSILGGKPEPHETIKDIYELDFAFQGEEGVEKVKKAVADDQPYELAFVDMRMPPGWDGLKTIEHIWQIDPCVQVIICSAYSDYTWEEVIARLGHKGSLMILEKPFDSAEISQLACALTEKYMLSKQVLSSDANLNGVIKQKLHELEIARADAKMAEGVIDDIMADKELPKNLKKQIKIICENSRRLLNTIEDVLETSDSQSKASA